MEANKPAMTHFAQAALATSDLLNTAFASRRFGGKTPRSVIVEAPNVESTGGGKQARESIILRSDDGDASKSLTVGFVDIHVRSCELRSWATLDDAWRARFSTTLDLPRSEYDQFLGEISSLLEGQGYVIKKVESQDRKARGAAGAAAENTGMLVAIGVVAAVAVLALVALAVLK